jgi:hypothetical protein
MKYYQKIKINYLEEITRDSLNFVKSFPEIYFRKKENASLYNLPLKDYLDQVPAVSKAFQEFNLICNRSAVYIMYNNKHTSLHKDCDFPKARINIPLLNCNNTYTKFYTNVKTKKWINPDSGVISYIVTNLDYTLIDQVEIDSPTVLRISEVHAVQMDERKIPRICLTLGFNKDPVFLLE